MELCLRIIGINRAVQRAKLCLIAVIGGLASSKRDLYLLNLEFVGQTLPHLKLKNDIHLTARRIENEDVA